MSSLSGWYLLGAGCFHGCEVSRLADARVLEHSEASVEVGGGDVRNAVELIHVPLVRSAV